MTYYVLRKGLYVPGIDPHMCVDDFAEDKQAVEVLIANEGA